MTSFPELDILRDQILTPIGVNHTKIRETEITAFLPCRGEKYRGDLLVIGRAVNGWDPAIAVSTLGTDTGVNDFADAIFSSVKPGCTMRWVSRCWHAREGYNTATSAFWRVIRRVTNDLGVADIESADWPSYLIWSNLYKVAPSKTGNPSGRLGSIQQPGCIEMLRYELVTYKPRRILFLTGMDWVQPFLTGLDIQPRPQTNARQVKTVTRFKYPDGWEAKVVVATHPQRKPEDEWVREVCDAFRS